jgi:hypothetical protein
MTRFTRSLLAGKTIDREVSRRLQGTLAFDGETWQELRGADWRPTTEARAQMMVRAVIGDIHNELEHGLPWDQSAALDVILGQFWTLSATEAARTLLLTDGDGEYVAPVVLEEEGDGTVLKVTDQQGRSFTLEAQPAPFSDYVLIEGDPSWRIAGRPTSRSSQRVYWTAEWIEELSRAGLVTVEEVTD